MRRNKMWSKVVAIILIGCMSIGIMGNTSSYASVKCKNEKILESMRNVEREASKDGKGYVILAKDAESCDEIKEDYSKIITHKNEYYNEQNNILTVKVTDEQAEALRTEDGIVAIEKDFNVSANGKKHKNRKDKGKDTDVAWNLQMINADKVKVNSSKKIKVAIIDSGVDAISGIEVKSRINLIDK